MKILVSAVLLAFVALTPAAPAVAETAVTSAQPFLASTTIDGKTYTYDSSLPRDQRTIGLKITKNDGEGETLVTSSAISTFVASKKFNDHPKLFGAPLEISRTSQYLVDLRDSEGNSIPVAPMKEGFSAVVYLSDGTPQLGTASVHLKFTDVKNFVDQNTVFDETITMDLDEGANTKKVGPYTVTVTVSPAESTSVTSL